MLKIDRQPLVVSHANYFRLIERDRLRQAVSSLLHEPSPVPRPLVRLRAWLRVPPEALLRALTSDRVGSARAGKALQVCLLRWELRSSQRLRLAAVAALPASP